MSIDFENVVFKKIWFFNTLNKSEN